MFGLKKLFGRREPVIETRPTEGHRSRSIPPPPPPRPSLSARGGARVRLILADGSAQVLPHDPELAARADYLVNGLLKPPPPA